MPHSDELMTATEVAEKLSTHPETVRRWAREGRLAAITLPSGSKRFRRSDVEQILARPA